MANGILRGHPQTPSLLVQMAGLFAKTVEMVQGRINSGKVGQTAQLVFLKGPFL